MTRKAKVAVAVFGFVLAAIAGCQTQAEYKKLAKQRWEKASAKIKLALAQQQYDGGQYEKANNTIQECLSSDADNPQIHLLYGKLLLARGHLHPAQKELTVAIEQNDQLHEGWYWLGVAAEQSTSLHEAYEHYSRAMSLQPTAVDYILAVADVLVTLDRTKQARELLTDKMTSMPGDVSLKVAAADLDLRNGETLEAARLYEQALLLRGSDDDIAESLGYCHILGRRWQQAAEIFEALSDRCQDEQKRQVYLELVGLCSMNAGRYGRAAGCLGKLSAVERDNAEFWLRMGQAALGAGSGKQAFVCSQRALALRPGWAEATALRGCAQYLCGDYNAAISSFEQVAGQEERYDQLAWVMTGRCYERLGEWKKADRAYTKALQIKPESELAQFLAKAMDASQR
jgi:tetratricopeptide (TPR) repeat protein